MKIANSYHSVKHFVSDTLTFGSAVNFRNLYGRSSDGVITIKSRVGKLAFRPGSSDLYVLREIFARREYDLSKYPQFSRVMKAYRQLIDAGRTPIIIDAGANIGASAIWFSRSFPEATVIAVEPEKDNVSLCRRNCEGYPNIIIREAAIGAEPGRAAVHASAANENGWASQTSRDAGGSVDVVSIAELIDNERDHQALFLVKVDVEGFEADLFSANLGWLSEVTVLIIELHDWMLPGRYSSRPFLKALGTMDAEILISGDNLILIR